MSDQNVVGQWYQCYGDGVYQFLIYFTGNVDVEDLVQETFLRAVDRLHTYQGKASPKTWLFSIARNIALDHARKNKNLRRFITDDELVKNIEDDHASVEDLVNRSEAYQDVMKMLSKMKPSYREVLILRGLHGLSGKETASVLGWTQSKVNVTYHRAIREAKRFLEEVHMNEDRGAERVGVSAKRS